MYSEIVLYADTFSKYSADIRDEMLDHVSKHWISGLKHKGWPTDKHTLTKVFDVFDK